MEKHRIPSIKKELQSWFFLACMERLDWKMIGHGMSVVVSSEDLEETDSAPRTLLTLMKATVVSRLTLPTRPT
jgi:hypothetical protein